MSGDGISLAKSTATILMMPVHTTLSHSKPSSNSHILLNEYLKFFDYKEKQWNGSIWKTKRSLRLK
jgi:hypothetical protein